MRGGLKTQKGQLVFKPGSLFLWKVPYGKDDPVPPEFENTSNALDTFRPSGCKPADTIFGTVYTARSCCGVDDLDTRLDCKPQSSTLIIAPVGLYTT